MDLAHLGYFSFCLMVAFQMVIGYRFPGVCVGGRGVYMCIYMCASIPALVCMRINICVREYLCSSVHVCVRVCV